MNWVQVFWSFSKFEATGSLASGFLIALKHQGPTIQGLTCSVQGIIHTIRFLKEYRQIGQNGCPGGHISEKVGYLLGNM